MRPPALTRRAAIIGASAVGAGRAASSAAAQADPLAALVREHDTAVAFYNANAPGDDEAADALAALILDGPCNALREPPHPTTMAGALAGLTFILRELEGHSVSDANPAVLRVCLDFLASREARS